MLQDMPEFAATPVGITGRTAAHLQAFHRRGRIVIGSFQAPPCVRSAFRLAAPAPPFGEPITRT